MMSKLRYHALSSKRFELGMTAFFEGLIYSGKLNQLPRRLTLLCTGRQVSHTCGPCGSWLADDDFATTHFFTPHHHFCTSRRSTAAQTLDPRASVDSCDNINNCRRLFDIIWGCITTIFACTWVSVHPNVPPPDQSSLAHLWRRLRMMFIAVIAPELIVGFTARQLLVAWRFSKKFKVTLAHGFFFSMGGFVSKGGHPITTMEQLEDPVLGEQYQKEICAVKADFIMGQGKGGALSKGIALMQGFWFIAQCLARLHQHLPVTELEVATLAFAVVNIFIYSIWWKKPLGVEQPIRIGPVEEAPELGSTSQHLGWWNRFWGALTGDYFELDYDPMVSNSVPSFWSMEDTRHDGTRRDFAVECVVGSIFGAIHCAAWNADFSSTAEMWMWRECSLLVTAIPMPIAALSILDVTTENAVIDTIYGTTFIARIPSYIIARLFLIVLPFTALRALPLGNFTDVNWSVYIPHL
ncbi:hypothetical protein DFH09DRAFT_1459299 [Mycena vulgaris]|nr:hypothetical protein DFH09DRAFT_1459299 [Mycena vulgaris]